MLFFSEDASKTLENRRVTSSLRHNHVPRWWWPTTDPVAGGNDGDGTMILMMILGDYYLFLLILQLVYSTLEEATPPLSYHVTEEQVRGTLVTNLSSDARLSPEVLAKIRFRFMDDSQPLFDIDPSSGVIRTSDVIDRDHPSLCRYRDTCLLRLDVAIQPLQYFQVLFQFIFRLEKKISTFSNPYFLIWASLRTESDYFRD